MSNENKKTALPKLRFPEFQQAEEWMENSFYDLIDEVLDFRGRTPQKLGMSWGNGNIVSLSANNVKNGFIDYDAECNLGSEALYEKWMGKVNLEKGDIVFTMEAPLGKALLVPDSKKYILSQRVVAFKTKASVDSQFIIQLIWSEQFQKEIEKLSSGSTAKGINQKALKTVVVKRPCDKHEQEKIAETLSSLDDLIIAQSVMLDALKVHKRGLMQSLFPAEGETVPKLRFPEFQGAEEWEEKQIGDYYQNLRTGMTPYRGVPDYYTGKIPWITSGELNYNVILTTAESITEEAVRNTGLKVYPPGTFFIAITGLEAPGTRGKCGFNGVAAATNQSCMAFEKVNDVNNAFLFYWYNRFSLSLYHKYAQGTKQQSFNNAIVEKFDFVHPSLAEQQKIADCLSSLDNRITAQSQKIEALKLHKKGLMQNLFPAAAEPTA